MQKRILVFSFSTLLLGLVLVASPPGRGVYSQSQPMFVAKGSVWVSGPFLRSKWKIWSSGDGAGTRRCASGHPTVAILS